MRRRSRYGKLIVFTAVVLIGAAACGDDGEDDAAETTAATEAEAAGDEAAGDEAAAAEGPPTSPTEIVAEDQTSDGSTVVVASITLPAPGFIAVHGDGGGSPGPVIGHSDLLPEGESTDVVVTLEEPLAADGLVFPMAHIDIDGDGVYEFFPPDETTDGPGLTSGGDVAVVPAQITIG